MRQLLRLLLERWANRQYVESLSYYLAELRKLEAEKQELESSLHTKDLVIDDLHRIIRGYRDERRLTASSGGTVDERRG